MFDRVLDGADLMWHRYQDSGQFSFTANGSGLHRTTCAHVRRLMPTEHTRPEGEAYDRSLQRWAHGYHDFVSNDAEERYSRHLRLHIMTPSETREWIVRNTGARGGKTTGCARRADQAFPRHNARAKRAGPATRYTG
ncbi:hypothetical protein EES37_37925 [Streptomyces sp. ADI91-18]|nr:hypothetical protein EES37_37925 [Streptomyces sp. ADI91-18]